LSIINRGPVLPCSAQPPLLLLLLLLLCRRQLLLLSEQHCRAKLQLLRCYV
jgi:hypothetical protein